MLELLNINKSYKSKNSETNHVLKNISLKFDNKGMTFILGKSGCGKSTLLNIIGGLDRYDDGKIIIDNKDTNNFKNEDFDHYRNNYIGFVFQDFNLIEEYTVYENIVLSLELQNQKINSKEIEQLLEKLEIKDLQTRRVNELSGGQKQRVAIARALIKKPKIILADEPTGNLDSSTSKQVMELLKEISKTTLVIVVSHDKEYAKKYNDRIIEMQDGVIANDTGLSGNVDKDSTYSILKTKLPFKDAFKLGFISLKSKKLKLFFAMLLISFSTIFLSIVFIINNYDIDKNHIKILKDEKVDMIEIKKYFFDNSDSINGVRKQFRTLKTDDINSINNILDSKGNLVYSLNEEDNLINFLGLNIQESTDIFNKQEENDWYTILPSKLQIIELNNKQLIENEKLIGKTPENVDEVLISNYLADIIIKNGIYEYKSKMIFQPKSYDELINSNKKVKFGSSNYVKIVGVLNYDLSKYQRLIGMYNKEGDKEQKNRDLRQELSLKSSNIYNKVYVKQDFIKNIKNDATVKIDTEVQCLIPKNNGGIITNINVINNMPEYYDGSNFVKTNELKKDEMLLSLSEIIPDSYDYYGKLNDYIAKNPNKDKLELEKEFVTSYIDLSKFIGQNMTLEIRENGNYISYDRNEKPTKIYDNIKVIGITGLYYSNINNTLFSKDILGDYIDNYIKVDSILVKTKDQKNIDKIIEMFPYDKKYSTYSIYSQGVEFYGESLKEFKPIINVGFIVFLVFSILLICNFMFDSISKRKKDIGILKSLGATNKDIVKIFLIEGVLLSIVSTIITTIVLIFVFILLNNTVMSVANLIISPFYINLELFSITFIYILTVVMISSLIPLLKISKMKPVDAIYNKK